jgi:hypothetical protein
MKIRITFTEISHRTVVVAAASVETALASWFANDAEVWVDRSVEIGGGTDLASAQFEMVTS